MERDRGDHIHSNEDELGNCQMQGIAVSSNPHDLKVKVCIMIPKFTALQIIVKKNIQT